MGLMSIFPKFQTRAKISQLDLDASILETHEANAKVTQNELEDASNVNDHMTLDPISLSIEGMISKTPLGGSALVASAATAAGGVLGKSLGGMGKLTGAAAVVAGASIGGLVSSAFGLDSISGAKSRSPSDVYDYLLELRNKRQPFQVVTALKSYDNMVITKISAPRSVKEIGGLRFTATFEQIKVARTGLADGSSLSSSLGGAATAAKKLGKQAASAASAKVGDNATILFKLFKGG